MTRKACRRKRYPLINPIQMAMEGAAITPDDVLDRLRLLELSAVEAFTHGRATVDDWRTVADVLNVAETMARAGVGPEVLEVCVRVQDGLTQARERYGRTGRMGLSGPAIRDVRDLVQYHDLQRASVSRSEYERHIATTANRIRSAPSDRRRGVELTPVAPEKPIESLSRRVDIATAGGNDHG